MSSQSEDGLVWIAIGLISGFSAVSAVVTVVNDGLVLTSAAIFWSATALGAAVAGFLFHSMVKRGPSEEDLDV